MRLVNLSMCPRHADSAIPCVQGINFARDGMEVSLVGQGSQVASLSDCTCDTGISLHTLQPTSVSLQRKDWISLVAVHSDR